MRHEAWMMGSYGRGDHGMFLNHFDGGVFGGGSFDMFGPVSLFTFSIFSILFFIALIWTVAIKGYALWHAAKRNEIWWFIALLIINTFGIFEIIYLAFFAKIWSKGDKKQEAHRHNKDKASDEQNASEKTIESKE